MFLLTMPDFSSGAVWISLLTLTFLEIVLGVDNIIFLSIISSKLPEKDQPKARSIGWLLAMRLRIALVFCIVWLLVVKSPRFRAFARAVEADNAKMRTRLASRTKREG